MSGLETQIDRLASPPTFFTLALLALLLALRSRWPWTRLGGAFLALAGAGFVAVGLLDPGFRALLLSPRRLPAALLAAGALVVVWEGLRGTHRRPANAVDTRPAAPAGLVIGLTLALVTVLAVAVGAPFGGPPDPAQPVDPPRLPWYLAGFQELALYLGPRAAFYALPALLLAALAALPLLVDRGESEERTSDFEHRRFAIGAVLGAALLLVLQPMLVAVFLRGPGWAAFGPFEAWDAAKPGPLPALPLSDRFWVDGLGMAPPETWLWRELPGLAAVAATVALVPWLLPRLGPTRAIFGHLRERLGAPCFYTAAALVMACVLIVAASYARWLLGVSPLVAPP